MDMQEQRQIAEVLQELGMDCQLIKVMTKCNVEKNGSDEKEQMMGSLKTVAK